MLVYTTARNDEHVLSLPEAKEKKHTRNKPESQKFHQALSFKEERTTTQDKDTSRT